MAYSLQKSRVATVVGIALIMALSACSSDQRHKRQVSGNELYLDSPSLKPLSAPSGMILPVQTANYEVPSANQKGALGKQLDIRPPVQPLALASGSTSQYAVDSGTLLFDNGAQNQNLWSRVSSLLQAKNMPIASREDANQTLTTDWIQWARADEDNQYEGRYLISLQKQGTQQALVVKTLELRQQGQTSKITDTAEIQRYNGMMMNTISTGLDKQDNLANSQSANNLATLDVQSSSDETGLPMLVVRAPYSTVWERLPAALEKLGMKVGDRSRPQGTVTVTHKSLSSKEWNALGAKDPELKNGDYKLQLGDLNNRTSLQFLDSKGKPLAASQNDALVAALQAAFGKTGA